MHHVRRWAHNTAHESRYNPWHSTDKTARPIDQVFDPAHSPLASPVPQDVESGVRRAGNDEVGGIESKASVPRRIWVNFKHAIFHSWVNLLLIFVPAGIAVHFAGINPNVVFALNAIAIIPLAGLLTYATECVAHRLGPTLGALLNVSFGNAVELIIFIALVKNEIRIVQASLIGSILANLLLILGMAFLIGGLQYREQVYDSTVTQMSACLLALAVLSLLIPTAFHASFNNVALADSAVLKVSRGTSVILLLTYVLYLLFQLKSHSYLYQGTPQHIIDEQSQPGVLARFDSTSSSSSSITSARSTRTTSSDNHSHRKVRRRLRTRLGMKRHSKIEVVNEPTDQDVPPEEIDITEKGQASVEYPRSEPEPMPASVVEAPRHVRKSPSDPGEVDDRIADLKTPASRPARPQVSTRFSTPAVSNINQVAANSAAVARRPAVPLRALSSFRPPPVFRTSINPHVDPNLRSMPPHQLRRLASAPNYNHVNNASRLDDNQSRVGLTKSRTETSTSSSDEPPMSQTASIVLLICSTALVALCAEFLVGSIEHLVQSTPLSEAFIGLIILPIVGNAAEHVTAVTVAAKNKLDLSLGVSLGSSIQIALFVTPIVVILGWILDKTMSLYFNLFETASLFVSTFIVNFLVLDGRSNYLEGALLCACYVILAVGAYFFPDGQNQSTLATGSGSTGS